MTCDPGVDSSLLAGWNLQFCMCDFGTGEPPTDFLCYTGGRKCITLIARQGDVDKFVCYDCSCAENWMDRGLEENPGDCSKSTPGANWSTLCVCPAPPGQ
jgi:hypothetical protein